MTIIINTKPVVRLADIGAFLLCPNLSIEYPKGYCCLEWFKGGAEGIAALCEKTIQRRIEKLPSPSQAIFVVKLLGFYGLCR